NVSFVNRYLSQDEVMQYLALTDIYVTPYLNPEQISSGPLAYAVALGKAVVSTPYLCAQELLADGRGLLVAFKDSEPLSQALLELVGNPALREKIAGRAAEFGRSLSWSAVAQRYLDLMKQVVAKEAESRQPLPAGNYGSYAPQLSGS
ncbi:MAG: glycosyltransferase, partial [bacterium]